LLLDISHSIREIPFRLRQFILLLRHRRLGVFLGTRKARST